MENFNGMLILWLVILVISVIAEAVTVGLTCIWVSGGALAALCLNLLDVRTRWQVVVFFVVTFALLFFTRPFAVKYINSHRVKTNYEGVIGKTVRIGETVDNRAQTGKGVLDGQEWTIRSYKEDEVIPTGSMAEVVAVSGVKLMVRKKEEE